MSLQYNKTEEIPFSLNRVNMGHVYNHAERKLHSNEVDMQRTILCFVVVKLQLSSTKRSCPQKVTGSVLQPGLLFVAVFVCKIVPRAACSVEKQSTIAWYIMSSSSIASDRRGRTDKTSRVRTVNSGTNRCN